MKCSIKIPLDSVNTYKVLDKTELLFFMIRLDPTMTLSDVFRSSKTLL